ncbi:JAB domain-containing protein [Polyangium mundeleinium]|uniref:JAB domain-containing protein n=1 Tax=Polyangium mundeleinium TaxID=2995306 RepID=A0ABT5EMZ8_9BACT|nr:JAB domain-containing protein [Polyangium mundeleinium]MDC0743209.1 JAB domain-containing protein [Polyangium mundeleinium]
MTGSPDASLTAPIINLKPSTTENLIDLVLGRPGVAAHVLASLGGLPTLARFTPTALTERFGLTLDEATRLAAAFELGHRRLIEGASAPKITCSASVAAWAHPRLGHLAHEEMHIIALSGQNEFRGARLIARGGLHALAVRTSDILRAALELAASGFVLVHNHPGGDHNPSIEDVKLTVRVQGIADLIGMPLVDHIIVTASGRFSSFVADEWVRRATQEQ